MVMGGHHHPCLGSTETTQPLERHLDIEQMADHVCKNDHVETFVELQRFNVSDPKLQGRMPASRLVHHGKTQVDAKPPRWLQRGKKIPDPRSNFQDS